MEFTSVIILCVVVYLVITFGKGIADKRRKEGKAKGVIVSKSTLPQRIKEYREKAGLEMEDVADALDVPWVQVTKWESGAEDPGTENLLKLAKLFNVSAEELLKDVTFF